MYLKASFYLGAWEHSPEKERETTLRILREIGAEGSMAPESPSILVQVNVAYWRKANQIHQWFISNLAEDGCDDCQDIYVEREDLERLLDLCQELTLTHDEKDAAERLPPQEGFFFGSTEIGEWYWEDVQDTARKLDQVLNDPALKDATFYYRASW